jgi:hypothetical protein
MREKDDLGLYKDIKDKNRTFTLEEIYDVLAKN